MSRVWLPRVFVMELPFWRLVLLFNLRVPSFEKQLILVTLMYQPPVFAPLHFFLVLPPF